MKALEHEFIRKVNRDIATKVTPIYNVFLLICAAFFAYFVIMAENKCFARDQTAYAVEYENTVDVTR